MTGALDDTWTQLHEMVAAAGDQVSTTSSSSTRCVLMRELKSPIRVTPSLDLSQLEWRYIFPLALVNRTVAELAESQDRLRYARFAKVGGDLLIMAELPLLDLSEHLRGRLSDVLIDFHTGAAVAGGTCVGADTELAARADTDVSLEESARTVLRDWIASSDVASWEGLAETDGYRLIRRSSAPRELPPACALRLHARCVSLGTRMDLRSPLDPSVLGALGLHLLEQTGRHHVRFGLDLASQRPGATLELRVPLSGLCNAQLCASLDAIAIAFDDTRREVQVLQDDHFLVSLFRDVTALRCSERPEAIGSPPSTGDSQ